MHMRARTVLGAAAALALLSGDLATASLTPAAAAAEGRGFYGGGFGGYRGGFGGYRGFGGFGFRGYGYGYGYGGYGGYGYRGYGGYGYRGYGGYYGGYGVGDALLGAAIIGGTAAIIASERPRYYVERAYPVYPAYPAYPAPPVAYGYVAPPAPAYGSNDPVELCSRAAVGEAGARGDSGRVTRIDRVDGFANGGNVYGNLEVRRSTRGGAFENARFSCTANYGQVTAFRFG